MQKFSAVNCNVVVSLLNFLPAFTPWPFRHATVFRSELSARPGCSNARRLRKRPLWRSHSTSDRGFLATIGSKSDTLCANLNALIFKITLMAARNGKVANLPNDIRQQLNLRLLEGETGRELAAWLNALPEVQSILGSQFNSADVSEVNLTHWRQGGYLQWLTERECFDAARALADGDCNLASAGLSAERLLNILTLRFGQLLLRWDFSSDETISETAAFSETARKARILQGISRSVLAIHRIQSRSAVSKAEGKRSSPDSPAKPDAPSAPEPQAAFPSHQQTALESDSEPVERTLTMGIKAAKPQPDLGAAALRRFPAPRTGAGGRPEVLSGPISPVNLSQTPFEAEVDLAEILKAV
jgi:hypothetical protein